MTLPPGPAPKRRLPSPPEPRTIRTRLRRLRRAELPIETIALAKYLIGAMLVSDTSDGRTAMRIVETEAYLADDAAAHSFRGETARNRSLFLRAGHAYVYVIYGLYFCMNVSSETPGVGAGVLIRAGEPVVGVDVMRARRPHATERDLCRGPGRLATALAITRLYDGVDLTAAGPLWLAAPWDAPESPAGRGASGLATSARIGITKERDRLLRFYERDSPFVSGPKRAN